MTGVAADGFVVFDLDDTLFLERDYARSGFGAAGRFMAEELGVTDFSARAWETFEAGVRGRIFDATLRAVGIEPTTELVGRLVDIYRSHTPDIRLLADAGECIRALRGRGTALAVITDGPPASQRAKAKALGVATWAEKTVFTAELGEGVGKPHPRAFELVEAACRGDRRGTYVADNPAKDFVAPRALGWATVRVRRLGSLHEKVDSGDDVDVELTDLVGVGHGAWLL